MEKLVSLLTTPKGSRGINSTSVNVTIRHREVEERNPPSFNNKGLDMFDTREFLCSAPPPSPVLFQPSTLSRTQKKPNQFGLFLLFPATTSLVEALGLIATWIIKAPFSLLLWRRFRKLRARKFPYLTARNLSLWMCSNLNLYETNECEGNRQSLIKGSEITPSCLDVLRWMENWFIMLFSRVSEVLLKMTKKKCQLGGVQQSG